MILYSFEKFILLLGYNHYLVNCTYHKQLLIKGDFYINFCMSSLECGFS